VKLTIIRPLHTPQVATKLSEFASHFPPIIDQSGSPHTYTLAAPSKYNKQIHFKCCFYTSDIFCLEVALSPKRCKL